jgi:hypothetical protein
MQRWEKIAAAVDAEFAHECELKLTEMRTSDGRVQYRRQCQICGATGQALKMARLTHAEFSTRTAHDPEIQRRWLKQRNDHQILLNSLAKNSEDDAWFREHDAYLQTAEWRRRRSLVLQRSGGICEGCRKNRATMVHHLTYAHWKRELLWELVAICQTCHDVAHDRDPES